jgi:hypothetical protein
MEFVVSKNFSVRYIYIYTDMRIYIYIFMYTYIDIYRELLWNL